MSNASMDCLSTLPVEILHRIFDGLDVSTIVLSLRITCRRLKAIIDNYDRYALDFRSISRSNFQLLCRLVHPRKVTSLTLAPMEETLDQIELFISYFRARQFNRLRSLTLINIKENQLKDVLKRFQFTSLTSFSFTLGLRDARRKNTTATLISSVIAKANLHYLDLDVKLHRVEKMIWPAQCTIRYLTIGYCDGFDSILTILRCSSHLQTLIIKFSYFVNETITRQNFSSTYFHQITSLTLENLRTTIDNLERLLSLMPALIHLKLIGSGHFMDGNRWEQFIQTNLSCLNQFELFVEETQNAATSVDVKSILTSFQTPFWLEHKKWFFTCEYVVEPWLKHFKLYSIPICMTSLTYEPESKKTFLSTFNPTINNNMSIMDNVTTIKLTASQFSLNDINQLIESQTSGNPLFRKITTLELEYNVDRLPNWIPFILTLVDLRTVTEIKLTGIKISEAKPSITDDLPNLLHRACNLTSLDIHYQYENGGSKLTAQHICAMTPLNVKHLATPIKNLDEAKICLEQLQHLTTAKFFYPKNRLLLASFIEWLKQNRTGSSHFVGALYTKIWFGNHSTQPKAIKVGNKRMKLIDEHHNS